MAALCRCHFYCANSFMSIYGISGPISCALVTSHSFRCGFSPIYRGEINLPNWRLIVENSRGVWVQLIYACISIWSLNDWRNRVEAIDAPINGSVNFRPWPSSCISPPLSASHFHLFRVSCCNNRYTLNRHQRKFQRCKAQSNSATQPLHEITIHRTAHSVRNA